MFAGSFNAEFERVINRKFSGQIAIGYRHMNLNWLAQSSSLPSKNFDYIISGYTVVPEFKFYWTSFSNTLRTPTGAYIAPFARIGYYTYDFTYKDNYSSNFTQNLTSIGGGIVMGFQVLAWRVFAVDVFMGPQIKYRTINNVLYNSQVAQGYQQSLNSNININTNTFKPGIRAGVTVGIGL